MHHKAEEVITIRYHGRHGMIMLIWTSFGEYRLLTSSKKLQFWVVHMKITINFA
jgi:hypothetical protein